MLSVKNFGKNSYGYWAYGILKYEGFEIQDIFSLSEPIEENGEYNIKKLVLKRTKNGNLKFKIEF